MAVPQLASVSGVLYRAGLKSDLAELSYGLPGEPWIVASQGRAEVLRGPILFRSESAGVAGGAFSVQAAAFSHEEPARQALAKLSADLQTTGTVAFSAERGAYRVLLGSFATRAEAEALAARIRSKGQDAIVVEGAASRPAAAGGTIAVTSGSIARRLASPVEIFPSGTAAPGAPNVRVDDKPYRGSLVVVVNSRGTLNVVNRVDLEEYLYGVVPAELGPKRYDEIEAQKAQAVAARTYAYAHRGQFEGEGYDLCATAKCQVYAGLSAEDPLSNGAVDATRGLVLASGGTFADALFISTCGGRTENVENVFVGEAAPYLVSVECGELPASSLAGARLAKAPASGHGRSALEWRGYVLQRHAPRRRAGRGAWVEVAQQWAGIERRAAPAGSLTPASVYPSIVSAFDLSSARLVHLLPREERYYAESPSATGRLTGAARDAYAFLLRFRFGAGEQLPPPDRSLNEEEYGGLLFSGALRLLGVSEASGRFLSREASNLWVRTAEGRVGLPVDPDLPLARRIGDRWFVASALTLRPGDRLRWWKRGSEVLGLWVELDPAGPSFERESAWTEWVRRASGRELARRMAARVAGTEVRELNVTRRSPSGRVVEMRVVTDAAETTLRGFDVRQALELPELAFTFSPARGPQGEIEFVFLGRGWGHGVGLCQNGAYGMAIAGATYDAILRHYYKGVDIVPASGVRAAPASLR